MCTVFVRRKPLNSFKYVSLAFISPTERALLFAARGASQTTAALKSTGACQSPSSAPHPPRGHACLLTALGSMLASRAKLTMLSISHSLSANILFTTAHSPDPAVSHCSLEPSNYFFWTGLREEWQGGEIVLRSPGQSQTYHELRMT